MLLVDHYNTQNFPKSLSDPPRPTEMPAPPENPLQDPQDEVPCPCDPLPLLRSVMVKNGINCYIVPFEDEHGSIHVLPKQDNRLSYMALADFTVTSGLGIVTLDTATLFLNTYDGQMVLPYLRPGWKVAHSDTDVVEFIVASTTNESALEQNEDVEVESNGSGTENEALSVGINGHDLNEEQDSGGKPRKLQAIVGYDPYLVAQELLDAWIEDGSEVGVTFKAITKNLVDEIWDCRPQFTRCLIEDYSIVYAGESWQSKVERLRTTLRAEGAHMLLITCLDEVAYLLNLRGSHEVDHSPMFKSFGIIGLEKITLYVNFDNVCPKLRVQRPGIEFVQIGRFYEEIRALAKSYRIEDYRAWIPRGANSVICGIFHNTKTIRKASPILKMLCSKNYTEVLGFREACFKDSIVGCELLKEIDLGVVAGGKVWTELGIEDRLDELRKGQPGYYGTAFGTISAVGPNSSMQLYQSTPLTNRVLTRHEIFLLDTGGMYQQGNTDWTRCWHFGTPTEEQRRNYAAVVRCYVAMATCVFPTGTQFSRIDSLARVALWGMGYDFDHAVGHGVGHFLNGVEYPIGCETQGDELYEGSTLAIEPGFYKEFEYGMRMENQFVAVEKYPASDTTGEPQYLVLEPLTFLPICRHLLDKKYLRQKEIDYINGYHARVSRNMVQMLERLGKPDVANWVQECCEPL